MNIRQGEWNEEGNEGSKESIKCCFLTSHSKTIGQLGKRTNKAHMIFWTNTMEELA